MHLLGLTVYLNAFSDAQSLRLTIEELDRMFFVELSFNRKYITNKRLFYYKFIQFAAVTHKTAYANMQKRKT